MLLRGVGSDHRSKTSGHYLERATTKGHMTSRHNISSCEWEDGDCNKAVKHWMNSAGRGSNKSLNLVQTGFGLGYVTTNDFGKMLHQFTNDVKSKQRDKTTAHLE